MTPRMFRIRRATRRDKPGILRVCRAIWKDDYIIPAFDRLYRANIFFVAVKEKEIVGLLRVHKTFDGQGFMSSLRVHPKHRREGIATALNEGCVRATRQWGGRRLRLWSEGWNRPAHLAARSMGYRETGRFWRYRATPKKGGPRFDSGMGSFSPTKLLNSPYRRACRGYLAHDFEFVDWRKGILQRLSGANRIRRVDDTSAGIVDPRTWRRYRYRAVEVFLLSGEPGPFLSAARSYARDHKFRLVTGYFPKTKEVVRAMKETGYQKVDWGHPAVLFEMRV